MKAGYRGVLGVKLGAAATVAGLSMLGLTGCARGLSLQPGQLELEACTDLSQKSVRYLDRLETMECDQAGRQVEFPSGDAIEIPPLGAHVLYSRDAYNIVIDNLGTHGVVAAQVRVEDSSTKWWGTKRALDQYWGAFGKGAPA